MEQAQRSRTLEIPAAMRALHQTLDGDPKILRDPIASRLLDPDDDRRWMEPLFNHPFAKQLRGGFVLRSRYAEDCLAEAVHRDVRQYLILGAGLDTFAYRQPTSLNRLRIYEVDHPITQEWKRARLRTAKIAIPSNLTFAPIDFEKTSLSEGLEAFGFAFDVRTFCSCLGVVQYLTSDAIDATLRFVISLPSSSEIVLSFVLPQEALSGSEADMVAIAAQRAAGVGEPWLSRLHADELSSRLRMLGFSQIVHLTPHKAQELYFRNRVDGLKGREGEQLMRAIV